MNEHSDCAQYVETEYYNTNFKDELSRDFSRYKTIELNNPFINNQESIKNIMRFLIRKAKADINSVVILEMKTRGKNSIIKIQPYTLDKLDINMCGAFKGSYNAALEYKIECENYILKKE